MDQLRTILETFFRPTRAFRALLDRPKALTSVLLLITATMVWHAAVSARADKGAVMRAVALQGAVPESGKEVSESELEEQAVRAMNTRRILGYLFIAVIIPLVLLPVGGIFWLSCRFSPHRVPFKNSFGICAHVFLPLGLRQLMAVPVILSCPALDPARAWFLFKTDLGSLLGSKLALPGLFLVDPFWAWMAWLFALGGREAGWKRWQVILAGLGLWLLLGFAGRMLV